MGETTNEDELNLLPYPGIDTLYKALYRNVERIPNHNMLGTKTPNGYKWMSIKEVAEEATLFAKGAMKLGLCPEVDAEDKKWRFIGIQSKNRKEWTLTHIANMHMNCTTVAMYDTLGEEASRYVINQTELITIACSKDYVKKLSNMKIADK